MAQFRTTLRSSSAERLPLVRVGDAAIDLPICGARDPCPHHPICRLLHYLCSAKWLDVDIRVARMARSRRPLRAPSLGGDRMKTCAET